MEAAETLVMLKYSLSPTDRWSQNCYPLSNEESPQLGDQCIENNGDGYTDRRIPDYQRKSLGVLNLCSSDVDYNNKRDKANRTIPYNEQLCNFAPIQTHEAPVRTQTVTPQSCCSIDSDRGSNQSPVDLCQKNNFAQDPKSQDIRNSPDRISSSSSDSEESVSCAKSAEKCHSPRSVQSKKNGSLFPKPSKERTLCDIVAMLAKRHQEDYFVGWTAEKIFELALDERPVLYPVTQNLKRDLISKSVLTENKKLAFCWCSEESWGEDFRQKLRLGAYKTLSDAKRDASALWREHCPGYDESRAVRMRDDKGNIVLKRTRAMAGSELEYRHSLRKAKVACMVDQIWSKRTVIHDVLQFDLLHVDTLLSEIGHEVSGYVAPQDRLSQIADIIAHKLKKELANCQTDK